MARSTRTSKRSGNGESPGLSYRFVDDMLAMAGSLANSRKDYAAEKLETLADSVREFSGALPDMPNFKAYAAAAAESFEGLASYVTESDLETMIDDARQFARHHPLAMLAGAIAAGVVVTQMVQTRSASPPASRAAAAGRRGPARRGPARKGRRTKNA